MWLGEGKWDRLAVAWSLDHDRVSEGENVPVGDPTRVHDNVESNVVEKVAERRQVPPETVWERGAVADRVGDAPVSVSESVRISDCDPLCVSAVPVTRWERVSANVSDSVVTLFIRFVKEGLPERVKPAVPVNLLALSVNVGLSDAVSDQDALLDCEVSPVMVSE